MITPPKLATWLLRRVTQSAKRQEVEGDLLPRVGAVLPPYTLLEPRGSRRGRPSYKLDIGLAKAIHLGPPTLELNLAVLNVLEFGMNIADAVVAPRIHHQWQPDRLRYESRGFPADVLDAGSVIGSVRGL